MTRNTLHSNFEFRMRRLYRGKKWNSAGESTAFATAIALEDTPVDNAISPGMGWSFDFIYFWHFPQINSIFWVR